MDQFLGRSSDEGDIFSGDNAAAFLPEVETEEWTSARHSCHHGTTEEFPSSCLREEPKAEQNRDLQRDPDEPGAEEAPLGDPQVSTSLQFPEENIFEQSQEVFLQFNHWNTQMNQQVKELGTDHVDWIEKINSIIEKITLTENTVKSLLCEVMSLEGQIEKMDSFRDIDPQQGLNIQEKITEIKKLLEEMDMELAQVDACNEAHELKEKLIEKIENFCKDMTVLNATLGLYQTHGEKTDSQSSEEESLDEMVPLLPEAPAPPTEENSPPMTVWKHTLKVCIVLYLLVFVCLSCYILLFDATFIFERLLPTLLGRERMWELREMMMPFLNLEVEDLLPS
ncbi:single-pass membrane and coiled-coil domain-containing protein 2 isoform X1 [Erinaceus europaeus]|uniref:Single-pass membrane and coiled-coil domain-containing protein 2 isoform X1 n=1 Tax=Erinaceus europaeus TaxID=9365 RepID=A0ABM3XNZ1_ERIEU|nr:single-pass membrane and coiled-coil domain-containing protein 2 isoform X1 [Erinaceus europaeus]